MAFRLLILIFQNKLFTSFYAGGCKVQVKPNSPALAVEQTSERMDGERGKTSQIKLILHK